jgi:4-aminobutyrate aminotransferase
MGAKLKKGLQELIGKGGMADVRGLGLMIGIEFDSRQNRDEKLMKAFKKGLLLLPAGQKAMRVIPPLTITDEEVQEGLELMGQALSG